MKIEWMQIEPYIVLKMNRILSLNLLFHGLLRSSIVRDIGITRQEQRNQINETQCRQKLDQKRQSSRIPGTF